MYRQIQPQDVRIGMYIRKFGGSWFGHPFWRASFVVGTAEDLERIHQSDVPFVVIDEARGLSFRRAEDAATARASVPIRPQGLKKKPAPVRWDQDEKSREGFEKQRAKSLVARSTKILRATFEDVRLGRAVRIAEVTQIVEDVVESVERSPRTLLDILRLKHKDEYTYTHSVAVCSLMVNAARHMNKTTAETRDYGLAGLLHDLGKMGVPDAILNKAGKLTEAEFLTVRDHPEHGFNILSQAPNMPEMALDVCRHHHEKMDGSGYPFGLPEDAISLVARLGAICDVYDALTSERVYKGAMSPIEAVTAMWSWDGHFDRAILFTFLQSIGVFPPGMLVRLRSNRLALVLENKRRASRPRVRAFYATIERSFMPPQEIVIQDDLANDSIVAWERPDAWDLDDWDTLADRLKKGESLAAAA